MALFRFHRGLLSDSLETTVIVKNIAELLSIINEKEDIPVDEVHISDYGFDSRCGWYTQIVCIPVANFDAPQVRGFLSEPL